ncbi:hypothetical protein M885DRAFT_530620 [Pelagophyceae sp. CCMP2097]|nr:hypothetical protein M885DRAFT_530620 [Pelagophyceae sp. CCMP2097]
MLSSAGVTRPAWADEKKERLAGAADIPIIRLNPGGILGLKVVAEDVLRASALRYSVVRPTGLKDEWPRGRSVFSQGDVAVGRTNPADLADALVDVLLDGGAADGKTFEMFTLAGYPAPRLKTALGRLRLDSAGPLDDGAVDAAYALLQQLLPGEQQDPTQLEMGQTYEQLDRGEAGRERNAPATEREQNLAGKLFKPEKRFFGLF